jgi:hypothetical protein
MWTPKLTAPVTSATDYGEQNRDAAVSQAIYSDQCERWLDHWYGGSAQRARLKLMMATRSGAIDEPRRDNPDSSTWAEPYLTDDGRAVRDETTELLTVPYVRAMAEERGVLYSADDLERTYLTPADEIDATTAATLAWYQHPARGGLRAALHLLDAWLVGLRTAGLLVQWCPDLGELSYQVLPPHWFHFWERPDRPCDPRLAYAVAYSEPEARDERGRLIPASAWTAYVRPALPGDPDDAPTRARGYEETGRLVRYMRRGDPWASPWPLPAPESSEVLGDPLMPGYRADGPNPLILAGGFEGDQRIWCPLVLHTAEPLVSGLRLPVADDQSQLGEELDFGLTSVLHTANLQSFGVPVYRGPGDPPDQIGPSHVVHVLDAQGDFYFRAPAADVGGHLEAVHRLAQIAAVLRHLPADTFTYQPPSIETGPAKNLRRAALIQDRSRRTVDAELAEHRRFDLERLLHNAHGVRPDRPEIPLTTRLVVRWGELAAPVDWTRRLGEMSQELSMGLSDLVDLVAERHGVDRVEAQRRITQRTPQAAAPGTPEGGDTMPETASEARE